MEGFTVQLPLRIDWSELDDFGHVNNVMFLKYIQASRINYWEHVGILEHMNQTGIGPMLASVTCDYKIPLYYPGQITVWCKAAFIKNTSFGFHHLIVTPEGQITAEAKDVMVLFDFKKMEKVLFPEVFRERISRLENREM